MAPGIVPPVGPRESTRMPAPRVRMKPFLSVVIPVYNEASCLGEHLDRVVRFLEAKRWAYEVLIVDDGSTDRTPKVISERLGPAVRLLSHDTNRGKGAAVRTGVEATTGTWVLITDADLSTPIEEAERLFAATEGGDGADVVFGSRALPGSRVERRQPFPREPLGRLFNWLIRRIRLTSLRDTQCGFKLLRGDVGRTVFSGLRVHGYAFDVELQWKAARAGYRVREVGVLWRDSDHSAVRPWTDGVRMVMDCIRIRFGPQE